MKDNSTSLVKLKIREMEERMLSSESEIIKFQSKNITEVQKVYSSYQPCDIRNSVVLFPMSYKIHKRSNGLTEFYRVYDKNELESIFYSLIDKKNDVLVSLNLFYEGSSDLFTDFLPLLKVSGKDLFVF